MWRSLIAVGLDKVVCMKAEYKEGPEASENFEKLAKAVLRAGNPKKQPKKKAAKRRKTSGKNAG